MPGALSRGRPSVAASRLRLTALLATQVIVNTGMTLGLLPVTGVPLPLMSYGGSGMVAYGLVIGLLVSISSTPARG